MKNPNSPIYLVLLYVAFVTYMGYDLYKGAHKVYDKIQQDAPWTYLNSQIQAFQRFVNQ